MHLPLRQRRGAVAACLAVAAACGGDAAPAGGGPAVRYRAVEAAASDTAAQFTAPTAVAVDAGGRVYVSDNSSTLTVLDSAGRVLRRFGRTGDAPGEFRYIASLMLLARDSLAVFDAGSQRLTVYAPPANETVARTVRLGSVRGGRFVSGLLPLPRGGRMLALSQSTFNSWDGPDADQGRHQVVRLLNADGSPRDGGVATFPADEAVVVRNAGTVGVTTAPFGRRSIVRFGADGRIYHGWTDSTAISVLSSAGRPVALFRFTAPTVPVTRADVDRATAAVPEMGGREAPLRRALAESAPRTWPLYTDFVLDDAGRVWVGLAAPWGEQREWIAYDVRGRVQASTALPGDAEVKAIRGGRVYALRKDQDDVPRLFVFGLEPINPTTTRS